MPVRILFDHQKFSTQRYGGISRYFANIIQATQHNDEFENKLGVLVCNNHYIKDEYQPLKNWRFLQRESIAYKLNQQYCKHLLKRNEFDIFHPTYYDPYFLDLVKKPLVVTVHDMTYERLPEYFWAQDPLTYQKRLNIERADKIIAISETTKKDLLKFSNVDERKIEVVYHGIDPDEDLLYEFVQNLPENYILFVGDRSGYKNFYLFMDAFKLLSEKYKDLQVVLTGGGSMGIADTELIKRMRLEDKVRHVNVTDAQLNFLYNKALAFVYPSLHEGFGLPILEAFKAHCPIILSDTDCFREIGADAAAFFTRDQAEDLTAVMDKVITDSTFRQTLVEKGKQRLRGFPLDKSISETLAVYKSLI